LYTGLIFIHSASYPRGESRFSCSCDYLLPYPRLSGVQLRESTNIAWFHTYISFPVRISVQCAWLQVVKYRPSTCLHVSDLRASSFLRIPDYNVLEVFCPELYTVSRPGNYVSSRCILVNRVGELLDVHCDSGLSFWLGPELVRGLSLVKVGQSLKWRDGNFVSRSTDIIMEKSLKLQGTGGRQSRIFDMKISTNLMFSQRYDIVQLKWLVVFRDDTVVWYQCCGYVYSASCLTPYKTRKHSLNRIDTPASLSITVPSSDHSSFLAKPC
jgi:hypothetical protein